MVLMIGLRKRTHRKPEKPVMTEKIFSLIAEFIGSGRRSLHHNKKEVMQLVGFIIFCCCLIGLALASIGFQIYHMFA